MPVKGRVAYVATEFYHHGGHTLLAADFIRLMPEREHFVLLTDILANPHRDAPEARLAPLGAHIESAPGGSRLEKLRWILLRLIELAPERIFWFNHHQDAVAISAAQSIVPGEKYFVHHGDHQLSLGIHVPCLRHVDLHNLGFHNCRDALGISTNVYWPLVCDDFGRRPATRASSNRVPCEPVRQEMRTSLSLPLSYDYSEVICRVLLATQGEHLHIGYLSAEYLEQVHTQLAKKGIGKERFVHVPWVPSVWRTLIDQNVDLSSWPLGGGKALIEAMGAGIPTLLHVNYRSRFHGGFDLAYEGALTWRTPEELCQNLSFLDLETLLSHSRMARAHLRENHHTPQILKSLLTGGSSEAPVALPLRDYHPDALQSLLDERKQMDGLRQVTVERDGQIASLSQAVAERDGQIASLGQAVAERDGQIASLGQAVAERDGQIASLGQAVAERDGQIASLGQAVAERDGQIASLGQAVAERDGQIASLGQAVAERDGQIASLNQAVDAQIAVFSKELSGREAEINSLNSAIREREASIAGGLTAQNALQAMLDAATTEAARLKAVLHHMEASYSWRLTAPLRNIRRVTARR